jgi:TPR repeat protein
VKAVELYKKGCEGDKERGLPGNPQGCNNVGVMFERGRGTGSTDLGQAAEYYEKACAAGLSDGCQYRTNLVTHMREECEKPGADDCTNLGYVYERGIGVGVDYRAAAGYYEKACNAGRPVGCSNMGILYDQGRGVGQDFKKAADLYRRACDMGGGTGCNNLAFLHEKGNGVKKDARKALDLYRRGCDKGSDRACNNVKILIDEMKEEEQQKGAKKVPGGGGTGQVVAKPKK